MSDFYAFATASPWLAFFLVIGGLMTLEGVLLMPLRAWKLWVRHRNIAAQGWPPEHLDADGDFKPEPKT